MIYVLALLVSLAVVATSVGSTLYGGPNWADDASVFPRSVRG